MRVRCGPAAVRVFDRRAERQPLATEPGRPAGRPGRSGKPRPSQKTCRPRDANPSLSRKEDCVGDPSPSCHRRRHRGTDRRLRSARLPAAAQTPDPGRGHSRPPCSRATVTPFTGTLKDNTGIAIRRSQSTAWARWSPASRDANPFTLDAAAGSTAWAAAGTGSSSPSINGDGGLRRTPSGRSRSTRSWPSASAPQTVGRRRPDVLVYYTTFDPITFATEPTLGHQRRTHRRSPPAARLTVTVSQYDDAGNMSTRGAAHGSWSTGARRVQTGMPRAGARCGSPSPGQFRVQATKARHHPLARSCGYRHVLLVALALVAAGCGGGIPAPGRAGRGHRARHPRLRRRRRWRRLGRRPASRR